ncbi:MAG: 16S rRNA (uracil(1498)-N(3))-methyltransferase [Bosea sp.]|jgi:16S rRNA (uracil1498-N3)-methyltransferase|nr:16S rRNA (uracil(1498)-N(3))-methyltransferase [Bosea sp. (in: a-proteobacteria)]
MGRTSAPPDRDAEAGAAGPRLFVTGDLAQGLGVALDRAQANYLGNVLRLASGGTVLAFNGRHGEWLCHLVAVSRKELALEPARQLRPQPAAGDLHYLFAPLKSARLDYMAQKAVEMGASLLAPVLTRRTQVSRINLERLHANAIEAAEQCGVLAVPTIAAEQKLDRAIAALEPERRLIFCDEEAPLANPVEALAGLPPAPLALLIGPEGGFDPDERRRLAARPNTVRISLGPRILRADTAAVAALAIVQSTLGDWRGPPRG